MSGGTKSLKQQRLDREATFDSIKAGLKEARRLRAAAAPRTRQVEELDTWKCQRCGIDTINRFNCPKCLNKYSRLYDLEICG